MEDRLERTFREMREADRMRVEKAAAAERPSVLEVAADATREVISDPKRAGSVFSELAYAVEDVRQKVVEAPTYGQEVTPSLHDRPAYGDPLMQAYAERREVGAEDLYGRQPQLGQERLHSLEHER